MFTSGRKYSAEKSYSDGRVVFARNMSRGHGNKQTYDMAHSEENLGRRMRSRCKYMTISQHPLFQPCTMD